MSKNAACFVTNTNSALDLYFFGNGISRMKVVFECSEWLIFLWKGFGIKNAKLIGEIIDKVDGDLWTTSPKMDHGNV